LAGLETRPFATTNKNVLGIFFFGDFFLISAGFIKKKKSRTIDSG
jgi:hypothetical protein